MAVFHSEMAFPSVISRWLPTETFFFSLLFCYFLFPLLFFYSKLYFDIITDVHKSYKNKIRNSCITSVQENASYVVPLLSLYQHTLLHIWYQVCGSFFPHILNNSVTPAGYPTIYCNSDIIYLDILSDSTGSVLQDHSPLFRCQLQLQVVTSVFDQLAIN